MLCSSLSTRRIDDPNAPEDALFALLVFGIGVKTNGLTALPVTIAYWAHIEGWLETRADVFSL